MSETLFSVIIEGFRIIPYTRMTGRGKRSPRTLRYLQNREALAWEFKKVWGNREPICEPVILSYAVHLSHRRKVDRDNITKAIQDALEQAGVVKDDCLIIGTDRTRLWRDRIDRVVVNLKRLKEEDKEIDRIVKGPP